MAPAGTACEVSARLPAIKLTNSFVIGPPALPRHESAGFHIAPATRNLLNPVSPLEEEIWSAGLRLIALFQLHEKDHRRFLILDEQDFWLRPDLVPSLMLIIHTIPHRLQFQFMVISHHDISLLGEYDDRYRLLPPTQEGEGVQVEAIEVME